VKAKLSVPAVAAAVIIFFSFGFLSFKRTQVWKDSDSLWNDVISRYPDASLPRGDHAQFNYNKAILIDPSRAAPLFQRVIEDCSVIIDRKPNRPKAKPNERDNIYYMRAVSYEALNQYEKALQDLNACLSTHPDDDEVLYRRGSLLVNHFSKFAEALADLDRAIQINPQGRYYLNRSICYFNLGNMVNARADAETALQKGVALPEKYQIELDARR